MKFFLKLLLFIFIIGCKDVTNNSITFPKYPSIEKKSVTENYWGLSLEDSYRNLEDAEDSLVRQWYVDQGIYTDNIINNIVQKDSLAYFLNEIDNRSDFYISRLNIVQNDNYFYLKKEKEGLRYKLYNRKKNDGSENLLFDPADFKPNDGVNYVINYIKPSPNGRYVVISLTYKGKEYSNAVIYDLENKILLPEIIDHCWLSSFYGVDWLPDSSGFTYLHFPNLYDKTKTSKHNTQAVLYKIGQNPKKLNIILSAKNNPELKLDNRYYPIVDIKNNNKHMFASIVNVGNFYDRYYANIDDLEKNKIDWKPLFKKEDKVYRTSGILVGDSLFYRTAEGASNMKINVIDLKTKNKKTIVPEIQNEVIKDFDLTKDGLFYTTLKNGVQAKLYRLKEGKVTTLELPKESGKISIKSYNILGNKLIVSLSGWLNKTQRFSYDTSLNVFTLEDLRPSGKFPEFKDFVVKEIEVPSHDGTLVPLSIIHHKDIIMDGKNPLFMDGYGAYGDNMSPYFSPVTLAWVAKGGVYATAHVRGGGEKGDLWHKGGMKETKPNTWKDLIACMEYVIDKGYTSKEHNAIWSSSAGGIMIGRAITERPDLFKVAISEAGKMNPLRSEESSNGTNYKEFGTVKDSVECMGLIEMDSYLKLKKDTDYPATLITAGMNDPRVAPWQSGKFVAKLQEVNTSNNPILFAVYQDSGHGDGTTLDQVYKEWANVYSFVFWQTGHPNFKLKEEAFKKD